MNIDSFRQHAHALVDWIADYRAGLARLPVRSAVQPGEIAAKIPEHPPEQPEPFDAVQADIDAVVLPGITHWQHPRFFAYFPSNASLPAVLGEFLSAGLGVQGMSWVTSPAATELETRVMDWLAEAMQLPGFSGVIQDTASTSTLVALLSARERATDFQANELGLAAFPPMVVYASEEAHSSIEKACRAMGIGSRGLRRVPTDAHRAMSPGALEQAILADKAAGKLPIAVVATLGTTSTTAVDPIGAVAEISRRHGLWLHVDAAYAGAALILPELAALAQEVSQADSVVMNPHKWLMTSFDCSAYLVRDPTTLVRSFEILPEYLRTSERSPVINYRDWGIALGRRFRSLKLWFVFRSYGVEGLRARLREHMSLARTIAARIEAHPDFTLLEAPQFALVCFRWTPGGQDRGQTTDAQNLALLERLNASGALYLSHTRVDGAVMLRLAIGACDTSAADLDAAWSEILASAR